MINNMNMNKDISRFGKAAYGKGNPTQTEYYSRLLAADQNKNKQFSWQLTNSLLPAILGL